MQHFNGSFFTALCACTLAACAGGQGGKNSQVVARVNDAEITVSQLRAVLQGKSEQEDSPKATRQAVEALINEQLLFDAAVQNKLDRDPTVVQALEGTRRQQLARAYIERHVLPKEEISAAEQVEYYRNHPALFQQRRIYQVTAYTLPHPELPKDIETELAAVHSAEEVARILAAHSIAYDAQSLTRAAEQLPLDELPRFAAAHVGDTIVLSPQDGQRSIMWIGGMQENPITLEHAQPIIQRYLSNVRNAQALDAYLKQARTMAKISYYGGVGDSAADSPASPPDPTAVAAKASSLKQGNAVLN